MMTKTIVWWSTILCTMSAIWSSLLEERAACEYHLSLTKYPKDQRVLFSFCYLLFALGSDHMTTKYPKDQRMLFPFCYLSFAQRFDHIYHLYYKSKKSEGAICYQDNYLSKLWIWANDHHLMKLSKWRHMQKSKYHGTSLLFSLNAHCPPKRSSQELPDHIEDK